MNQRMKDYIAGKTTLAFSAEATNNLPSPTTQSTTDPQPAIADLRSSSWSSSAHVSQPATDSSSLPAGVVCSATDPPEIPSVRTKTRKRRNCGKDII